MKFLVPNYSCLQNPWLGGFRLQIPVLSVLNWICWTPPSKKIPGYATAAHCTGGERWGCELWVRLLVDPSLRMGGYFRPRFVRYLDFGLTSRIASSVVWRRFSGLQIKARKECSVNSGLVRSSGLLIDTCKIVCSWLPEFRRNWVPPSSGWRCRFWVLTPWGLLGYWQTRVKLCVVGYRSFGETECLRRQVGGAGFGLWHREVLWVSDRHV